jgi:hypothetical protein
MMFARLGHPMTTGSCCGAAENLRPGAPDLAVSIVRHGLASRGS